MNVAYDCTECLKYFQTKYALDKHMQNIHPGQVHPGLQVQHDSFHVLLVLYLSFILADISVLM